MVATLGQALMVVGGGVLLVSGAIHVIWAQRVANFYARRNRDRAPYAQIWAATSSAARGLGAIQLVIGLSILMASFTL
jgi:hypothetical protein